MRLKLNKTKLKLVFMVTALQFFGILLTSGIGFSLLFSFYGTPLIFEKKKEEKDKK